MSALPSDEVAEDYKNSLEDLVSNDRYQISNLTLIARENVEHAEAIARVLQNHINRAPPARKLPALYVLDSIVKNVGSPYTVYFGRNLHQTFMYAYSQVDGMVRRKLEEMLKTWREPVIGSLTTAPVFPLANTQTIVDALNRLRASTVTPRPGPPVGRVASVQSYRATPPPQTYPMEYPAHSHALPTPNAGQPPRSPYPQLPPQPTYSQSMTPTPLVQYSQRTPQPYSHTPVPQPPVYQNNHRPGSSGTIDLAKLEADIDDLTTDAKIECATHPLDQSAQKKLATLQTLKEILESGNASENDLVDIRNSIMQEMAKKLSLKHQTTQIPSNGSLPQRPPVIPSPQPYSQNGLPYQPFQQAAQQAPASMFSTTNLAELLRMTANQQQNGQNSAPYPPYSQQQSYATNTPPVINATPASVQPSAENPLLAQLRASGLLSATGTTPQSTMSSFGSHPSVGFGVAEVTFTSASIKIQRPHLITTFLSARPNQCTTCGRRFTSDDVGREKKARHLDWHFKTKARMLEAEARGQTRSWYVDEREWIATKEFADEDGNPAEAATINGASPAAATKKKQEYVRVPADPVLRGAPCPIDQEPFRSEWSEEVQDFIWKDAVLVGGKYYHASCYQEVVKHREVLKEKGDGRSTPQAGVVGRVSTPDSVLGKRKAEVEGIAGKARVKLET